MSERRFLRNIEESKAGQYRANSPYVVEFGPPKATTSVTVQELTELGIIGAYVSDEPVEILSTADVLELENQAAPGSVPFEREAGTTRRRMMAEELGKD